MIVSLQDARSADFLSPGVLDQLHEAARPVWTRGAVIGVGIGAVLVGAIAAFGLYGVLVEGDLGVVAYPVLAAVALLWLITLPWHDRRKGRRRAARHIARTARRLGLLGRLDALAFTWCARVSITRGYDVVLERRYRRRGRRLVASLTSTLGNEGRFRVLDVTDDPTWVVVP